jgi:small subunit ribosomal protein S8
MAALTDPIADLLTRIRNANSANHDQVEIPASKMKVEICRILVAEKFVKGFQHIPDDKQGVIRVHLKYGPKRERVITNLKRVSKPGLRVYKRSGEIQRVLGGLGIAIVSTSRGLMTDVQARREHVGGEVLCQVW